MTCHCGNCEDHPDLIRFTGTDEDLGWMKEESTLSFKEKVDMATKSLEEEKIAAGSLEELAWESAGHVSLKKAAENAKDYLLKIEEERRQAAERDAYDEQYYSQEAERLTKERLHIILSKTEEQFPKFRVRVERDNKILYDKKTGIEAQYLGFVSEDYILPLRDLLEQLGFDVRESYE